MLKYTHIYLHRDIFHVSENIGKTMKLMRRKMEDIKKMQTELLEVKNTASQMKMSAD